MVDHVVPIVKGGLVHRRVHAVVRQPEIALVVLRVDEDVLRPVAECHNAHGKDVGNDERPQCGREIDKPCQEHNGRRPNDHPEEEFARPLVTLRLHAVVRQLDPDEHRKVEPIPQKVEQGVPLEPFRRRHVELVVVLYVVHDDVVELVDATRNAEERRKHPDEDAVQELVVEHRAMGSKVEHQGEALLEQEDHREQVCQAREVPDDGWQVGVPEVDGIHERDQAPDDLHDVQHEAEHGQVALVLQHRRQRGHQEGRPEVVLIACCLEVRVVDLRQHQHAGALAIWRRRGHFQAQAQPLRRRGLATSGPA
mmetsp:Transcript_66384/g.209889  ORF Transcript_66384/g.209889 Transcript_66384/m.209889 type:complete len:309 (-) Transcript_66384:7-933(-)